MRAHGGVILVVVAAVIALTGLSGCSQVVQDVTVTACDFTHPDSTATLNTSYVAEVEVYNSDTTMHGYDLRVAAFDESGANLAEMAGYVEEVPPGQTGTGHARGSVPYAPPPGTTLTCRVTYAMAESP